MYSPKSETTNGPSVITESTVKSCVPSQVKTMKDTLSKMPGCKLGAEATSKIICPNSWSVWELLGVTTRGRINEDIHVIVHRVRRVFEEANRSIAQVGYDGQEGKYLERLQQNLRKDEAVSRRIPNACKAITIHRAICTLTDGRASHHLAASPESTVGLANKIGGYTKEHQVGTVQLFQAMDIFMVITNRAGWKSALEKGRPMQDFFDSAFPDLPAPASSTNGPPDSSASSGSVKRTSRNPTEAMLQLAQSEIEGYKLKLRLLEEKHSRMLEESRSHREERDRLDSRCRDLESRFRGQAMEVEVWRETARLRGDPRAARYPKIPLMHFATAAVPWDGTKTYPFYVEPRN